MLNRCLLLIHWPNIWSKTIFFSKDTCYDFVLIGFLDTAWFCKIVYSKRALSPQDTLSLTYGRVWSLTSAYVLYSSILFIIYVFSYATVQKTVLYPCSMQRWRNCCTYMYEYIPSPILSYKQYNWYKIRTNDFELLLDTLWH